MGFAIQRDLGLESLIHFTTRDRNLMALESELLGAHALGIRDILALTGDPPSVGDYPGGTGIWDIDSVGLIGILVRLNRGEDQAGRPIGAPAGFTIACALDPTAADLDREIERLASKIEAGAHLIMTQPIYAAAQWQRFMERASARWGDRLPLPVLLGVLPLHTSRHAEFLHHEVPGITIPDEVRSAMAAAGERGMEVGLEAALELLRRDAPPGPGHLRHAQLRALRAVGRAGTPGPSRGRRGGIMRPAMDLLAAPAGVRAARHLTGLLATIATLLLILAPLAAAQTDEEPFPARADGVHIVDDAKLLNGVDEAQLQADLQALLADSGIDIVVYTREQERVGARRDARADAARLLEEWQVGGTAGSGAVMLWNINPDGDVARSGVALGSAYAALDEGDVDEAVNSAVLPGLQSQDWISAVLTGQLELQSRLSAAPVATPAPLQTPAPGATPTARRPSTTEGRRPTSGLSPEAGPAFPDPINGLAVYDYAEVISPAVIERLGRTIAQIEERTGAEIVVYTQVKPSADDPGRTEQDAIALIDQWGVGRQGFDDGLAIFFNLREDLCHGQVQLYAAPGFSATYLTNAERQAIFEEQMLPASEAL